MKFVVRYKFVVCLLLFLHSLFSFAQEENASIARQGTKYIDLRIKSLEKYNSRIERQQQHLLNKLKHKEQKFEHKLKASDSTAYALYKKKGPSYDSIGKIADTGSAAANFSKKKNPTVDSLKAIESFVQNKTGNATGSSPDIQSQNAELTKVKGELNYKTYISQLISQRAASLEKLGGQDESVPGLTGIQKQVFYANSRMKVFKDMEEDPSKAEDQAMEYLQGTSGFDKAMKGSMGVADGTSLAGANAGSSSADLQKMGFQTKQQLQTNLQNKFGGSLGTIGKNAAKGLQDFQSKMGDASGNIKDAKQSFANLKNTEKPSFKVNPMRGLPFFKRIEKHYSFQTTHPTSTGAPAIFEPSVMVGFKHSPRLTYGLGAAGGLGLGQNWQRVHFSYQGIGLRSFATWQWQYGFGLYAGYERMYKQFVFNTSSTTPNTEVPSTHNTANYNESILVGLTKKYNLNKKYDGDIQVLYDIWWQQKGLPSPLVLRFETISK